MTDKITEAVSNLKIWFTGLNMRNRIIITSAAVLVFGGICTAAAGIAHLKADVATENEKAAHTVMSDSDNKKRATEQPKKQYEDNAEEPAEPEKTDAVEIKKESTDSKEEVIAKSAASSGAQSGGSDVVAYQKQNEAKVKAAAENPVPKSEQRIIATSAAVCDIMDRLGIDLIGVPSATVSAIPSRYSCTTTVGSPMDPDLEIIKSLNPSDVIGPDTLQADLQMKYDNIGVCSTFINLRSVQGLYDSVRLLGNKYSKTAEADAVIDEYNSYISEYTRSHEGKEKPKVLVLMGLPGSYLVATQNSYAGSLVELAGGINVFHDDTKDFMTVNTEEIYAKDPDVIIRTAHGLPEEALAMFNREFAANDIWKHFRAVQNGRVYDVDYMLFGMSATFDYPQALSDLETMLYGA